MDTMVIIFKALALVPIGYALGLGMYWLTYRRRIFFVLTYENPIMGMLGVAGGILFLIGFFIKEINNYPMQIYLISAAIGMIIYGVRKFIKDYR